MLTKIQVMRLRGFATILFEDQGGPPPISEVLRWSAAHSDVRRHMASNDQKSKTRSCRSVWREPVPIGGIYTGVRSVSGVLTPAPFRESSRTPWQAKSRRSAIVPRFCRSEWCTVGHGKCPVARTAVDGGLGFQLEPPRRVPSPLPLPQRLGARPPLRPDRGTSPLPST